MLKKIAKRINKEIEQARDYIDQAYLIKHKSAETAELFVTLAKEEIDHAKRLLKEGQRIATGEGSLARMAYDLSQKNEVTEERWHEKCKVIWEWEHRMVMDDISEIEYKISQYRTMMS